MCQKLLRNNHLGSHELHVPGLLSALAVDELSKHSNLSFINGSCRIQSLLTYLKLTPIFFFTGIYTRCKVVFEWTVDSLYIPQLHYVCVKINQFFLNGYVQNFGFFIACLKRIPCLLSHNKLVRT